MISKDKVYVNEGERGTPYTLAEARLATEAPDMDAYHKEIMSWLIYEVERLELNIEKYLTTSKNYDKVVI